MSGGQCTDPPHGGWDPNPNDAEAHVHWLARQNFPPPKRNEELAKVMHMEPNSNNANNVQKLITYPPLRDAFHHISTVYIQDKWKSRPPGFRITDKLVTKALSIQLVPGHHERYAHDYTQDWAGSGPAADDWSAEDHYTQHICRLLRYLERHNPPYLEWLTSEPHEKQVWILYHIILFLHMEKKYRWWRVRRWYESTWATITLQVPKKLSPYHYHNRLADLQYSRVVRLARRKLVASE
ncbi:uncharacterized protein E0L32_011295 [Thyridium curvatum]|uniref:Uncharacterized protein n=1 Tax=Thyridium curvatum TaxID=1093900 RepID=A0A507BP18_9PEZI|nr:uncharacterized protein E0L32_011295 [Thyridium curvatum]TPX19051.1 hypothetical protein E0L32_011295 [Thyridium curvatum]